MSINETADTASEDSPRSGYMGRKEVKIIGLVLVAFLLLLYPIYNLMVGDAQRHICQNNLGQIMKAINIYAIDNNDRFPIISAMDYEGHPQIEVDNSIYTWMSAIKDNLAPRASFLCPTASDAELVTNNATGGHFVSAYGMYLPYSGADMNRVNNPGNTVLITETSNLGANGVYNPVPLIASNGKPSIFDGHVIGWDSSEKIPIGPDLVEQPSLDARFVTRLAFPNTKSGNFLDNAGQRHSKGINALTVSGTLIYINPPMAQLNRTGANGQISGLWSID
ncbi:MAG: hypothetical protein KF784_09270 [Fimbriimonadaceae bacterium]|nr:hypothetical protein [Fimbriimonadaceae bacterium]